MHGRIKVRTTAEQEAIKKVERAKKVVQYRAAINLVFQKRKDNIYDDEMLMVTAEMVLQNPDINTIWNIRREAFEKNNWTSEEYEERLNKELRLTENCLRENPKSYGVWHHRCWIIDHLSKPDWKTELSLCAKFLNFDERNFHGWDYRQHLVKKAGISDEEEFEFSTAKIVKNFSNYSSWHYRSKILSKMFPDESGKLPISPEKHKEELDLVMNATFTDPTDSSAWFYQRWLLDYNKSSSNALWLAKVTKKKIIIIFHDNTKIKADSITLVRKFVKKDGSIMENDMNSNVNWCSYNNKDLSRVWIAQSTTFLDDESETENNEISSETMYIKFGNEIYNLHKSKESNSWYYKSINLPIEKHNDDQLKEQMDNYKQLVEMEPNNKWAILTGIFLMKNYDSVKYHEKILQDLSALIKIDSLRANYYADIRSKYIIDNKLLTFWQEENNFEMNSAIDLSNLELTNLYNEHFFSIFEQINLSGNQLNRSLHQLVALQNCKKLLLSNNKLKNLKNFPILPNLEYLSLRYNELTNIEEILNLLKHHNIIVLDLRNNPLWDKTHVPQQILNIYPNLELQMD
ncbi:hypothetical protein PV326_004760 [Microctonus aethiopoides]|nr:hypothetical protein PV326_004760 [Microctonus aethiopoides]